MSSRIRFNDANDVFEAFPTLTRFAPKPKGAADPLAYARALDGASPPSAASAYISHLLPRREAVWWACQCLSAMPGGAAQDEGLRLASQWVREPDEAARREALAFSEAHLGSPTSWLARAVGYSGGSVLAPDQPPLPAPPEACAQAVNAALVLAAAAQPSALILPWLRAFAEAGVRFAEGEEAKVTPPAVLRTHAQLSPQ